MTKWKWKTDSWLPGFKEGWRWEAGSGLYAGSVRDAGSGGNVLRSVSSIPWLGYCTRNSQDVSIGERRGKGTRDLSRLFYNHVWIYSYLKIKRLIKKEKQLLTSHQKEWGPDNSRTAHVGQIDIFQPLHLQTATPKPQPSACVFPD